jgi:hypothetical protein
MFAFSKQVGLPLRQIGSECEPPLEPEISRISGSLLILINLASLGNLLTASVTVSPLKDKNHWG